MMRIDTSEDLAEAVARLGELDPRLAQAARAAGTIPLRRTQPGYAALVSIVVSQLVSRASAEAIFGRLAALARPLTPDAVLAGGAEMLRQAGLSRPKQATVLRLADAVVAGRLDLDGLVELPADDALASLVAQHGIGPWTAEVYLLFALGHADIFPAGDLALQVAAADLLGLPARPDARAMAALAESWSPWRGAAARVLWAHYRTVKGRDATPDVEST